MFDSVAVPPRPRSALLPTARMYLADHAGAQVVPRRSIVKRGVLKRGVVKCGVLCLGFPLVGLPLVAACTRTADPPPSRGGGRGGDSGPAPVVVAKVTQKDVPIDVDGIGNVEAFETISVRAQVTGELTEVLFREGDYVRRGDHLFSIDRR